MSLENLQNNLPSINLDSIKASLGMAPSLPKTFKAAIFKKQNGPLEFEELELKEPGEGEILIKVLATGVCHSDADVQAGTFGNPLYTSAFLLRQAHHTDSCSPMVPGHEAIGEVVAVGPKETLWKVGDRAGAGWHGGHDGKLILLLGY